MVREAALLRAASEILRAESHEAVTLPRVAAATEDFDKDGNPRTVPTRAAYRYFPTRESLLKRLLADHFYSEAVSMRELGYLLEGMGRPRAVKIWVAHLLGLRQGGVDRFQLLAISGIPCPERTAWEAAIATVPMYAWGLSQEDAQQLADAVIGLMYRQAARGISPGQDGSHLAPMLERLIAAVVRKK